MRQTVTAVALLWCSLAHAQNSISAREAINHVGKTATVCGQVASSHYAQRTRGSPTFLNLDEAYPSQVFTIVIWGSDRPKFGDPERAYSGKHICVTGKITVYRGVAETAAHDPFQIKIK